MSWQEETAERRRKYKTFVKKKEPPQTTKQTVTLTTVPGQKAHEKSLNGTYRLQRRPFQESPLCLYYHDNHTGYTTETTTSWLQTNRNSISDYDRQFSKQCDIKMLKVVHRNQSDNHCKQCDIKMLKVVHRNQSDNHSKSVNVTGQTHSYAYHYYIYCTLLQQY